MSSWWMVEDVDNRAAVMKKSQISNPELSSYLQINPSQKGYLDKLSKYKKWQARYWEIRGPYLVYWIGSTSVLTAAEPLGAIDTRLIKPSLWYSCLKHHLHFAIRWSCAGPLSSLFSRSLCSYLTVTPCVSNSVYISLSLTPGIINSTWNPP